MPRPAARPLPDPTISLDDLPPVSSIMAADDPDPERDTERDTERTVAPAHEVEGRQREPRRISLARFQNVDPPHQQDRDSRKGGSGADGSGG